MTIIEKIKAKIEILRADTSEFNYQNAVGYNWALDDVLSFLSTLESEKPMNPEKLEEELDRFIASGKSVTVDDYGTYKVSYHDFKKIARHFAEWQKEQDDKLVDTIYQQGIEKGKDEMMKKAIEGHLFRYPTFTNPLISVSDINPDAFTNGDTRVKLIIIKEEER